MSETRRHHGRRKRSGQRAAAAKPVASAASLGVLARECEAGLAALGGRPDTAVVRDFWRRLDALHGGRPDYVLWRRLRGAVVFRGKPGEVAEPALRALRSEEAEVRWAGLALVAGLPEVLRQEAVMEKLAVTNRRSLSLGAAVGAAARGEVLAAARWSCEWVRWLALAWAGGESAAGLLERLRELLAAVCPGWKPGRAVDLAALEAEGWLPVEMGLLRRWSARALAGLIREAESGQMAVAWLVTAWLLLRDARPLERPAGAGEVAMLLDAAGMARAAGLPHESARLAALALHLTPARAPDWLARRCRVTAWAVAEAGLRAPVEWAARLEEMPFPGDPLDSAKGREAVLLFADEDDPAREVLRREVESDADWAVLREAGVVLHHPLAALGWIAKKAGAYAVKKQHALLEAALRLALWHLCLVSAGKMLAVWPGGAGQVLELARCLRAGLLRMPVLRDEGAWRQCVACLRAAWGRLEPGAITDEENLFFLHETLADRLETIRGCLPEALRGLEGDAALAAALRAEPRLLAALEHQRTVELWEVAALLRERVDLTGWAWVSVALAGEAAAGRFSVLVLGAGGRELWQGRLRAEKSGDTPDYTALAGEVMAAARRVAGPEPRLLLALDEALPEADWAAACGVEVARAASLEAAFRARR